VRDLFLSQKKCPTIGVSGESAAPHYHLQMIARHHDASTPIILHFMFEQSCFTTILVCVIHGMWYFV